MMLDKDWLYLIGGSAIGYCIGILIAIVVVGLQFP